MKYTLAHLCEKLILIRMSLKYERFKIIRMSYYESVLFNSLNNFSEANFWTGFFFLKKKSIL